MRMIQCPADPSKSLSTAAPEMLRLAGYSSSLINRVSFQLQLWMAKDWEAFLGDIQPHGSYVGRRDHTMFELKLGQDGVKAGGEVQGGFGYQVSVT